MLMTSAILLISPGRWQQAKMQQPIGVVGLVIIILSMSMVHPVATPMIIARDLVRTVC